MLIEELKKRMFDAMKRKAVVEKEIIRTVIGEATATGGDPDDDKVTQVIRKLVKSNEETLKLSSDEEARQQLERELLVLKEFMPRSLGVEEIKERLTGVADAIRAAGNEGQAMGVAMKALKAEGAEVEAKDVKSAVAQLRS